MYGVQKLDNLNLAVIDNADGPDVPLPSVRESVVSSGGLIEVHFHDLEAALIREIKLHPVVVGCMAWLTNEKILIALSTREAVSIIVNKEDFLRPDRGGWSQEKIRRLYRVLPESDRYSTGLNYSYAGDPSLDAVRCAGICAQRSSVPPRMHHKFLVFCKSVITKTTYKETGNYSREIISREIVPIIPLDQRERNNGDLFFNYDEDISAISVWTGSFNASENGTRSIENAVILRDPVIAAAYLSEWRTIQGISEPLDWSSEYVDPEWRIGT